MIFNVPTEVFSSVQMSLVTRFLFLCKPFKWPLFEGTHNHLRWKTQYHLFKEPKSGALTLGMLFNDEDKAAEQVDILPHELYL